MSLQESTATFLATQSELNEPIMWMDEHLQGAMTSLEVAIRSNASHVELVAHTKWYRNAERRYSKIFTVILKNGTQHNITSKHTISEKEFFLRKLKYG